MTYEFTPQQVGALRLLCKRFLHSQQVSSEATMAKNIREALSQLVGPEAAEMGGADGLDRSKLDPYDNAHGLDR